MKYFHCSQCGIDSTSKSGMMQHAFEHLIIEKETKELIKNAR